MNICALLQALQRTKGTPVLSCLLFFVPSVLCSQQIGGPGGDEICQLAGRDSLVYAAGIFQQSFDYQSNKCQSQGGSDVFLFCQNTHNDKLLWMRTLGSSSNDNINDLDIDNKQSIYVLGQYNKDLVADAKVILKTDNPAVFLLKYNAKGLLSWAKNIGGKYRCQANDLHCGADGKLYLTGYFQDSLVIEQKVLVAPKGRNAAFVLCFDAQGKLQWAAQPAWSMSLHIEGAALAADARGNVYWAGSFSGKLAMLPRDTFMANPVYTDVFLTKINAKGQFLWAKKFGGVYSDYCRSLLLTPDNRLFMAGELTGILQMDSIRLITAFRFSDVFVAELDTAGRTLFARQSLGNGDAFLEDLYWDGQQLHLGGYFRADFQWQDSTVVAKAGMDAFYLQLKLDGSADRMAFWAGEGNDLLRSLWMDDRRRIWAAGSFQKKLFFQGRNREAMGFSDCFLVVYGNR